MSSGKKKVAAGNKWLKYSGKGLPKLPELRHGKICKTFILQGFSCNGGEKCRFGGHVSYGELKPVDKDILDKWVSNSHDLQYIEG